MRKVLQMEPKLASAYCIHDDHCFFAESIRSFEPAGPVFAFVSRRAWNGTEGDWEQSAEIARAAGASVVEGEWLSEGEHRKAALDHLVKEGYEYALIPDGDEIIEARLLDQLVKVAQAGLADRVSVCWDTYWKSAEYVIRPREGFTPLILLHLGQVQHVAGRFFEGGRHLALSADHGLIHHLSYAGSDERIKRKIETWGHRDEVVPGWFNRVWKAWDENPFQTQLHPTHPAAYLRAERAVIPKELESLPRQLVKESLIAHQSWPKVSIVIPLYGQKEAFARCLESLDKCHVLWEEVIVVDNASPDGAAEEVGKRPGVRIIQNPKNEGFARACNQGAEKAQGDVLLFLNSDTIVPAHGLKRLVEGLISSPTVGAAGPYSNNVGHFQQIEPFYSDRSQIELFAEDFAKFGPQDREVDMLVGFCLAIRRSTFNDLGGFDESFGVGTFEDNDLCYRLRRNGYRLLLCGKSYVHHEGSLSLREVAPDVRQLLQDNERRYVEKWIEDLESGFATGLSGLTPDPIRFQLERKPESQSRQNQRISLCMIVKNEERVLGACLESARPFFDEIIIVDTGSTDRTVEIAKSFEANVIEQEWPDSFAEARNWSLAPATGDWVFWLDADDTLPSASGRAIRRAAESAPAHIHGFIVPVQFVEDGPGAGTRVDHVKLLRNLPGLAFEGRIHEQILPSLKPHGGEIARLDAIVLHSGYDTSPEGQARKAERDWKLLRLEYRDRGDHPFVLFNIGMTRHYGGRHEDAIRWLKRCLRFSKPEESHVRKVYAMMAVSHREQGRLERALQILSEGLDVVPGDPELHFLSGMIQWTLGQLDQSEQSFLSCLRADISGHYSSIDVGILGYKSYANLAGVALAKGTPDQAFRYWREGLNSCPQVLDLAFACFDVALESKNLQIAQSMMEHVRNLEGPSENWAKMLSKYAGAANPGTSIESELARAAAAFPESIGPRLVLMRRLLESERLEEALPLAEELAKQNVAEAIYALGIFAVRAGDFSRALELMIRANQLEPNKPETMSQIGSLRKLLEDRSR